MDQQRLMEQIVYHPRTWRHLRSIGRRCGAALLLALGAAVPASAQSLRLELTEVHLGVPVRLVLHADDSAQGRRAARAAFDRLAALDGALSDYRPDSDLRLLEAAAADTAVPVSADLFAALGLALRLARETDGAFDPAAGALTRLWREARERGRLPDSASVAAAVARGGWQRVRLDSAQRRVRMPRGLQLDLGGIGKGLALQEALAALAGAGVTRALFEAGGDLVIGEAPPGSDGWRVSVIEGEPPQRLTRVAVATSGPQEQHLAVGGTRYSHVLDPRTGWPLTAPDAVSVIAEDGALADALATAFSVLGRERALALAERWPGLLGFRWHPVAAAAVPAAPTGRPLTPAEVVNRDRGIPPYGPADVAFMTGMVAHHAQALAMANLAATLCGGPAVRTLASRIHNAQQDEIALMQQWLRRRGEPVPALHVDDWRVMVHGGGDHAGTCGPRRHARHAHRGGADSLAEARGAAFDRLFLTSMIRTTRAP
jgi:FAD:protein FMN transferase